MKKILKVSKSKFPQTAIKTTKLSASPFDTAAKKIRGLTPKGNVNITNHYNQFFIYKTVNQFVGGPQSKVASG